jgi:hypothetical protein
MLEGINENPGEWKEKAKQPGPDSRLHAVTAQSKQVKETI